MIDIVKEPGEKLRKLAGKHSLLYRDAPVDDEKILRSAMTDISSELGGFDILINSAGVLNEQQPAKTILTNYVSYTNVVTMKSDPFLARCC